ncbi:hypothetical protein [Caloramator proteoclasticus]|uniref:Uncharacterized protein n=1 Tax=Caloramator proteoclasticus DSM 10124 TaxID=1121262 RepID=A0A1M4ZGC3_9CLOT|nr:hypothetical protein [Caloramator proteoclasticus]SHF16852.1 hypothetical protein SAMN02746091_01912 [Caloramator proteoclasticus DSM 10124]
MCWKCKHLYYIDGQARCELDYRELSLADMANDECVVKGVKKDEQSYEKEDGKTGEVEANR